MAKHRKTRQQKMVADQRHVTYHLETNPAQVSHPSEKKSELPSIKFDNTPVRTATVSYAYVKSDLRKTALVTSAIVLAQILIFIFLNRV